MDLLTAAWCVFLFAASTRIAAKHQFHPLSDEFISLINSKQNSWTAGRNFPLDTSLTHIKMLMGALKDPYSAVLPSKAHDPELIASLPENFDPRDKWPNCSSLNEIRNQGCCGSCWAFGAVAAMTDRVCTYSNGTKNFHFSADDLVSCGPSPNGGCLGGYSFQAWHYWTTSGIVSGGPYMSSQGCRPYEVPPAPIVNGTINCTHWAKTPACVKKCQAGYGVKYEQDRRFGKNVYKIPGEDHIKAELYANGPVEADFVVYEDFLHYKSGVYSHAWGELVGFHAIKLMGWGVEDGKKYWLCANSFGYHWGLNGFFKILRGKNDCGIENDIVAGEPALDGL